MFNDYIFQPHQADQMDTLTSVHLVKERGRQTDKKLRQDMSAQGRLLQSARTQVWNKTGYLQISSSQE